MGKGDKKSKKGKRWKGSYGVSRNKSSIKARLKRASSKKVSSTSSSADAAPKAKRTSKKKEA
ncbi:MAG TPA: 30S ribosomal protein THX [Cyclobacteriaceae bacterium]|nr:30S ribosomal protein THX [Cyclobacteriaceae bacterium]